MSKSSKGIIVAGSWIECKCGLLAEFKV